jgi:hypothetical protein
MYGWKQNNNKERQDKHEEGDLNTEKEDNSKLRQDNSTR